MSKTYKGDVTGNVVELNLLDANEGTLPNLGTPTVVTRNTGPNAVEQIVGDIETADVPTKNTVKGLVIGTSCTSIGSSAFYYCGNLTGNLVIPDSVTTIEGGVSFAGAFIGCSGFNGNLVIPDSVTSIGAYGFGTCSGFDGHLVIPDSVTSIGAYAFSFSTGLTALYTNTPAASWIGTSALAFTTALVNIYYGPDANGGTGYSATFQGGSGMTVSAWTNYPNIP